LCGNGRSPPAVRRARLSAAEARIDHRAERPGALERVGGTTHNDHATLASNLGETREQRRLSDPGVALDDRNRQRPAACDPSRSTSS
jgi:hypothetical protein